MEVVISPIRQNYVISRRHCGADILVITTLSSPHMGPRSRLQAQSQLTPVLIVAVQIIRNIDIACQGSLSVIITLLLPPRPARYFYPVNQPGRQAGSADNGPLESR